MKELVLDFIKISLSIFLPDKGAHIAQIAHIGKLTRATIKSVYLGRVVSGTDYTLITIGMRS